MATLFEKETRVFNRKYGAGKVIRNDGEYLSVVFDYADSDFKGTTIGEINPECLHPRPVFS